MSISYVGATRPNPLFFVRFTGPRPATPAVEQSRKKAAIVRSMAERCVAGEFEGGARSMIRGEFTWAWTKVTLATT